MADESYKIDRELYGERLMRILASLGRHSAVGDHPNMPGWRFLQIGGWGLPARFGDGWVQLLTGGDATVETFALPKGRAGLEAAKSIAAEVCNPGHSRRLDELKAEI